MNKHILFSPVRSGLAVFVSCTVLFAASLSAQGLNKSILDYGAKAQPGFMNTMFIQKAIDEVSASGGGVVLVPSGTFLTGSIHLKSGVNLHLQKGAAIKGSDKRADYDHVAHPALLYAKEQHHISITSEGMVDGNGRALMQDIFKRLEEGTLIDPEWKTKRPTEKTRTNLIYFEACDEVLVRGGTFKDATSWVTHYERCRNVVIDSITLESLAYWNNDGIDVVDCKNVRITNSFINAADDAICLKSARRGDFCDSIYVADCRLRSSANAFKLGTGSTGGFRNITVRNLTIYDTYRSAIALEAVDGGFLENIDIRHVVASNTGNAIFIKLGHRNKDSVFSRVENIYIKDIKVEVPAGKPDAGYEMEGPLLKYPKGSPPAQGKLVSVSPWNHSSADPEAVIYRHNVFPSSISGLPGHPVKNVRIEDIAISYAGGADKAVNCFPVDSFHLITEAEKDYPEFSMFGELPAWGFYVRHAEGISFKNMTLTNKKEDYRTAILMNDVNRVNLSKLKVENASSMPVLLLNDVKGLTMKKIKLPGDKKTAVSIMK